MNNRIKIRDGKNKEENNNWQYEKELDKYNKDHVAIYNQGQ